MGIHMDVELENQTDPSLTLNASACPKLSGILTVLGKELVGRDGFQLTDSKFLSILVQRDLCKIMLHYEMKESLKYLHSW